MLLLCNDDDGVMLMITMISLWGKGLDESNKTDELYDDAAAGAECCYDSSY